MTYMFKVFQEWLGVVIELDSDSFQSSLKDMNSEEQFTAVIPRAEVPPGDQELIRPGAEFYLIVGEERDSQGTTRQEARIRFRRVVWSRHDLAKIDRMAHEEVQTE